MADQGNNAHKKLSSSTSMASEEDLQVYCQPCDEEGPRLPAHGYCTDCEEYLCKTCFNVHKKHKLSKHHTLLDAASMPKSLRKPTPSPQIGQTDDLATPCLKHSKEMIKYYCNDHNELLCSVCVTLDHKSTSCKVKYIPDISGDIIDSIEYQVILKAITSLADKYQKILEDVKKLTSTSNISVADVLTDIKKYRKAINQRLDELERQVVNAAKIGRHENSKILKTVETTCEDMTKLLKTTSDTIKQLNTSKQSDKLFMELKLTEKKMREAEDKTVQLTSYDVKEHNFKPNEAILTQLKTEKYFGKLTNKSLIKDTSSQPVQTRQTSYQGKINVKMSKDKYSCYITGMTLLTPDLLIITDQKNRVIKMVDTKRSCVADEYQLNAAPWDITAVTITDLAVTLPDKKAVKFLSISSNKLEEKHTMKVDGECWGISCYHGKLIVSFCRPVAIRIYTNNGTVLREIDGKYMFKYPRYVTGSGSSIYVSDCYINKVIRLNWQGEVIGCYGDSGGPVGIALSDNGTVFVCNKARSAIEEISGNCRTGTTVMMNVTGPLALCWCGDTNKLYYSCDTSDYRFPDFIFIHKLSQI